MSMIEVRNLTKSFGPRVALAGVNLSVETGEFVTLVGPNGAGKTTLLRVLATLTRPTSGTVLITGLDPAQAGEEIRRQVGFFSQSCSCRWRFRPLSPPSRPPATWWRGERWRRSGNGCACWWPTI